MATTAPITRLLEQSRAGDADALEAVLPLLYRELRRLAARQLARERAGHTLQPTALVHEAYLQLVGQEERGVDRGHFLSLAALAMRRVLVHHAERRAAQKRGGDLRRITLSAAARIAGPEPPDLLDLDRALERLARIDERAARIVDLRFFAGLSNEETAQALALSERTVEREWRVTRAWLRRELGASDTYTDGARDEATG